MNKELPKPSYKFLIALILLLMCKYSLNQVKCLTQPIKTINDGSLYLDSKSVLPYTPHYQVLGSLIGIDREIKRVNLTPYAELNRIIWFESSNDPTAKNPNSSAEGYCQIIKSTREAIEKEIGEIDWENPEEQLRACIWLYENGIPENEWKETEYLWKQ